MQSPLPTILVVEDDERVRKLLKSTLLSNDFSVIEAETAKEGVAQAASRLPDIILLDLGLPDRDGLDLIREIRGWSNVPIIVLSARDMERDKVEALDAGADDYVSKPFGGSELLARIRVSLRHLMTGQTSTSDPSIKIGDLELDLVHRKITREGSEIKMTRIEYKLLTLLARHTGKVLTHRQLLQEVWGPNHENEIQYLRGYMASLRRKIEAEPSRPQYLITESGIGYRLMEPREGLSAR